ncbi:hypothetical protein [Peribacillus sp. Hz7]|uniref:hypothetical protein n=1 Tax=Peribacillus sp. Hz7 TaxID=3344873 RepID=UPI0035CAC67A
MKLLMCLHCHDPFNLDLEEKTCKCGSTKEKYVNQLHAIYSGEQAVLLGFTNSSLIKAIQNQPKDGFGELLTAFVIPEECSTFVNVDTDT